MDELETFLTPTTVTDTRLVRLSAQSRLIVTGQIGCGKTTLARAICSRLHLSHLHIDDYNGDDDPAHSATRAANSIDGGWVAEANVWQIPSAIWESADLAIFLDYPNRVHYLRILRRCLLACMSRPSLAAMRRTLGDEWGHMKIMYLYANKNRQDWTERGGITNTATPVIRSTSPRATSQLLFRIGNSGPKHAR